MTGTGGVTGTGGMTSTGGNGQGGGGQGGGGGPCAMDPNDNTCETCVKQSCCAQLTACYANPDCQCVASCIMATGSVFGCYGNCGVRFSALPPGAAEWDDCLGQSCAMGGAPPCELNK
jgi:hypothetical protein